jgi:signal transduction histidine kinase
MLAPLIQAAHPDDPDRAARTLVALQKLLMLDAGLATETYIARHQRELSYLTRELEKEGRRLERDYESQRALLRRTLERAKAAEELASIGILVTGLAHEIGTPMGVIQGHAKMLESAIAEDDARWRLKTIQDQIGRISRIIQTLLNIARPGKSKAEAIELEPLLRTTLSFVQEKLTLRAIRVESEFGRAPRVNGDPERLQQLFLNLFLNAADAMPEGGVLRVRLTESEDGEIDVRVADTGAGIREEDVSRIFEPFFTTKAAGEGYGLGLMVAKGIVTDHGGTVEVSSSEGEGTEFRILFPPASSSEVRTGDG